MIQETCTPSLQLKIIIEIMIE